MDFLDHIIYTANTANVREKYPPILSDYAKPEPNIQGIPGIDETNSAGPRDLPVLTASTDSFPLAVRENFIFYDDPIVIDKAIQKHWFDINFGPISAFNLFQSADAPPYHLIYAYLLENSRIGQIFEKLIYLYQHDEVLGVASASDQFQRKAAQWIFNTENLFYKTLSNNSYRNISGNLRPNQEANRRNAYYRMFGMDLAFGDPNSTGNTEYSYYKAKTANKEFIILFEQFLSEVWQGYINAQNTSGANTTDYQRIIDMAMKLRQMLLARRGSTGNLQLQNYRNMNLSKEEYSSVGFMSWLFFIISYDSPLVNFLGCQANTASERLANIGRKVGIDSHKKSQALLDMAGPMATLLRTIEYGTFEINAPNVWVRRVIESQTQIGSPLADQAQRDALIDILAIINNWEKATGHKIKNPESNITGTVRISSNGIQAKPVMN